MQADELKHSSIYEALKKNKNAQNAVLELGAMKEWTVLKQFVGELKQTLLEATLDVDSLDEIKRLKFLISGMESIVLLPSLVDFVKETEKDEKTKQEEKERDDKRRKFNPGAFIRDTVNKVKGV